MSAASAVIELLDARGRVYRLERVSLDSEHPAITIGRSLAADVVIDDEYAAAVHARIAATPDGRIVVGDLGSVNGIIVGGKRLHGANDVPTDGCVLQIGRTLLRVRTPAEVVAPELPDHSRLWSPLIPAVAGALVFTVEQLYQGWLSAPRELVEVMVSNVGIAAIVLGSWIAFWGLMSRIILGTWNWLRHAAIAFCLAGGLWIAIRMVDFAWFTLSLPRITWLGTWAWLIALGVALYLHLVNASSLSARRALQAAVLVPLLAGALSYWMLERPMRRDVNAIEAGLQIWPPGWRLVGPESEAAYFARAAALREAATKRLSEVSDDADGDDGN